MMIQDHRGQPLFTTTKSEEIYISPTLAEAIRLRWYLDLAKEHGYENLIIELDADVVVKCHSGRLKLAEIDNVMRSKNMAAHSLVGVARIMGSKSWLENVPNPTSSIV
ncbi:hypothetical protein L195_g024548, partial [Trifolium pratense]